MPPGAHGLRLDPWPRAAQHPQPAGWPEAAGYWGLPRGRAQQPHPRARGPGPGRGWRWVEGGTEEFAWCWGLLGTPSRDDAPHRGNTAHLFLSVTHGELAVSP